MGSSQKAEKAIPFRKGPDEIVHICQFTHSRKSRRTASAFSSSLKGSRSIMLKAAIRSGSTGDCGGVSCSVLCSEGEALAEAFWSVDVTSVVSMSSNPGVLHWGCRGRRFKSCRPDYLSDQALWPSGRRAFSIQGRELRRREKSSNRGFRVFFALR